MNPDNIRTDEEEHEELPVEPEEEQQPEVRMVTRKYNGNEYEMPEHLAQVWDERNASYVRQLSDQAERIRREASQYREPVQPRTQQTEADPDKEWYASPSQREAKLREELRREWREEQAQIDAQREFWNDFWTENPDLRGRNLIVRAAFQELLPGGGHMTPQEFRESMAATVRSQLGTGPAPTRKKITNEQVTSPPQRGPGPTSRRAPAQEEPPSSLQSTIRQMQEAKRKAFLNPPDDNGAPQPRRGRGR